MPVIVSNNPKGQISNGCHKKTKHQIFRKLTFLTNEHFTCVSGVRNVHFQKIWYALFPCNIRFEICPFALLLHNLVLVSSYIEIIRLQFRAHVLFFTFFKKYSQTGLFLRNRVRHYKCLKYQDNSSFKVLFTKDFQTAFYIEIEEQGCFCQFIPRFFAVLNLLHEIYLVLFQMRILIANLETLQCLGMLSYSYQFSKKLSLILARFKCIWQSSPFISQ